MSWFAHVHKCIIFFFKTIFYIMILSIKKILIKLINNVVLKTNIAVQLNNRYIAWLSNSAMVCYYSNIDYIDDEAPHFCKRHTVYILATNTSACSIRALFQHKEMISLTLRNSPWFST